MMPATIRRDSHRPHACSGGNTALICRNVVMLSSAAERDRSDPRVGTDSVMRMSQHKMVTFVNGNVVACGCRLVDRALPVQNLDRAAAGGAGVHVRGQQNGMADYSAEPRSI